MTELVAGEADNHQALVLVLLIEGLQAFVLGRKTAFGSGVGNQEHFPLVLGEIHFPALVAAVFELVNGVHVCAAGAAGGRQAGRQEGFNIHVAYWIIGR